MKLSKALCLCRLAWPSWVRQGVWVGVPVIQMSTQSLIKWLGSRHMAVLSLFSRHPTAAFFAPFQWQSAKARGKDSLLPSGVSIRTSTYWTRPQEFGWSEEEGRSFHFLLCAGNRYSGKAKVWKAWSVSPRPRWRPFYVFLQKNTQTTLLRKATAVQFLLYSWLIANMFSYCSQSCDETLGLCSKTKRGAL